MEMKQRKKSIQTCVQILKSVSYVWFATRPSPHRAWHCLTDCCTCSQIPAFSLSVSQAFSTCCATLLHHGLKWHKQNISNIPPLPKGPVSVKRSWNGPTLLIHIATKIWFRCCLIWLRKWARAPSHLNPMWLWPIEVHLLWALVQYLPKKLWYTAQ
jgi:hypothetical protein